MPDRLRELLAGLAAEDAAALVAETRAAGRAEAAELLRGAWRDAYLVAAGDLRAPARDGTAWWVYGVIAARDAGTLPELPGVEGAGAVEAVAVGDLAALVSEVPLEDFGDEQLRRHLEDLEWVERVARAHEGVLESVMAGCAVVPLRLCTICLDRDRVAALVEARLQEFAAALAGLHGRSEWGVKVFAGAEAAAAEAAAPNDPQAYLDRKRRARDRREHAHERAVACARSVHDAVAELAVAVVTNPPQPREAHGREADMVLNGAYLVADERRGELADLVVALAAEHAPFAVELTGPWPPYNFAAPGAETLGS